MENKELQRNYYAIIPANVRYDKELSASAKLFYGEITALCNEKGYCWASNDYFATLYNVTKKTISCWISELNKKGYIISEIIYKEGTKEIVGRYIRICDITINKNVCTPINENVKKNNKCINNKEEYKEIYKESENNVDFDKSTSPSEDNNNDEYDKSFGGKIDQDNFNLIWAMYPKKQGKIEAFNQFCKWTNGRKVKIGKNTKTIKITAEQIYDFVESYANKVRSYKDPKFIKNGATFFGLSLMDYLDDDDIEI